MKESMTHLNVKLRPRELELLASLAQDQLFRREFIDSRIPGSQLNRAEINEGKALMAKLQTILDSVSGKRTDSAGLAS